ncbi:MAG: hypothetical protein KDA17_08020 [Candidatus Saccharibacteria bacterium]|nr:hypothetical protein [Candidatus Saccharibacteria bacterium]
MPITIRRLATNHVGANGGPTRLLAADGSDLSIPVPIRPAAGNGVAVPLGTLGQVVSEPIFADRTTQMGLTVSTNMDLTGGARVNPFQPIGGGAYYVFQEALTLTTTPTIFAPAAWTETSHSCLTSGQDFDGIFTIPTVKPTRNKQYVPTRGISYSEGVWTLPANGLWRVQMLLNTEAVLTGNQTVNAYWATPGRISRYGGCCQILNLSGGLGFEAILPTFSSQTFALYLSSTSSTTGITAPANYATHISFSLLACTPTAS